MTRSIKHWLAAFACLAALAQPGDARAEATELRIGVQFGLTYLPLTIMRQEHFVEQQAKAAGLGDVKVTWIQSAGGDSLNDALLSGNMDVASSGYTSFLILWSKTKGRFAKGLFAYGHTPFTLVTRNPDVKTAADLSDKDRIAVPAVRSSLQAIYLQMAAEKAFGPANLTKFDHLTLSRSHPDAMAAMLGNTELDSHFAVPPYTEKELAAPGVHALFQTEDVTGEPISNGVMYTTVKFYDANPKLVQALRKALEQAMTLINTDKPKAAQIYLAATHENIDPTALAAMMTGKGVGYELTPLGSMLLAKFMHKTNQITMEPVQLEGHVLPHRLRPAGELEMFAAPPDIKTEIFARVPDHLRVTQNPVVRFGHAQDCFLEGPSFDRAGNLYTVDLAYGRIFRITPGRRLLRRRRLRRQPLTASPSTKTAASSSPTTNTASWSWTPPPAPSRLIWNSAP